MEFELKAQIAYESLCENYGKKFIDGLLEYLKMDVNELSDDITARRILALINNT